MEYQAEHQTLQQGEELAYQAEVILRPMPRVENVTYWTSEVRDSWREKYRNYGCKSHLGGMALNAICYQEIIDKN